MKKFEYGELIGMRLALFKISFKLGLISSKCQPNPCKYNLNDFFP